MATVSPLILTFFRVRKMAHFRGTSHSFSNSSFTVIVEKFSGNLIEYSTKSHLSLIRYLV